MSGEGMMAEQRDILRITILSTQTDRKRKPEDDPPGYVNKLKPARVEIACLLNISVILVSR